MKYVINIDEFDIQGLEQTAHIQNVISFMITIRYRSANIIERSTLAQVVDCVGMQVFQCSPSNIDIWTVSIYT